MEDTTPEMIFAALKLIEQLYHDGHISQKMFRDILFEHSDVVDITQFNRKNRISNTKRQGD